MTRPVPQATQDAQYAASAPHQSAWVSANAGSGKTHVLSQRVVRLLLEGVAPSRILCLTFTKIAAANMSERVFSILARWTRLDDDALRAALHDMGVKNPQDVQLLQARRLFARTVETPGGLKIQTLHAFCEKLLHQFPFEANVPAQFEALNDAQRAEILTRIRSQVIEAAMQNEGTLGGALRVLAAQTTSFTFDTLIKDGLKLRSIIVLRTADEWRAAIYSALNLPQHLTPASVEREMIEDGIHPSRWEEIAQLLIAKGSKTDKTLGETLRSLARHYDDSRSNSARVLLDVETYVALFLNAKGEIRKRLITAAISKPHPDMLEIFEAEAERLLRLRERQKSAACAERSAALLRILREIVRAYEDEKGRRGLLDFDDLITRTHQLLERSSAAWVHYKLDRGIDHILVDEAQDTSTVQWAILAKLSEDFFNPDPQGRRRTFFAVGDEKQSIFSFQGAAPDKFVQMRDAFARRAQSAQLDFEKLELKLSFRSSPGVLQAVDDVFKRPEHFKGLSGDVDNIQTLHEAWKEHLPGLIEFWPALGPDTQVEEPEDWRLPVDALSANDPAIVLARRVAAKIRLLLDPGSSARVCDSRTQVLRPVQPGDILILVRRRNGFFDAIIRALKDAQIPVAGADRLNLTQHIAIQDLLALGRVCLLPEDDLSLACVLKSPLIGFDDDDLIALAPNRAGSLWAALGDSAVAHHREAAQTLAAWRGWAVELAPFAFYMRVLGKSGGRKNMEARLGSEALDAMDEFLRIALEHEKLDAPSLTLFLDGLQDADLSIKRDMEAAGAAVRVMTVHAAKGLESKIVFLPDTCALPVTSMDSKLVALDDSDVPVIVWAQSKSADPHDVLAVKAERTERGLEEYRRLLYVALTRAEEQLYISGYHGSRGRSAGCWHEMIETTLFEGAHAVPADWDAEERVYRRIHEGRMAPQMSAPSPLAAVEPPAPDWLWRAALAEAPVLPPLRPSSSLAAADQQDSNREAPSSQADIARTRGKLMHLLLQFLPDIPQHLRVESAQRFMGARGGVLDAPEQERLISEAMGVLNTPSLAALFGPSSRAEVAVAGQIMRADGVTLDVIGQIDRLVETNEAILIADYKTGAACTLADVPESYIRQCALYRAVLEPLWPNKPVRAVLIWTQAARVLEIPTATLDAAIAAIKAA